MELKLFILFCKFGALVSNLIMSYLLLIIANVDLGSILVNNGVEIAAGLFFLTRTAILILDYINKKK